MTCLWQHKNATQHDLGSKKPIFFNCLLDGAHTRASDNKLTVLSAVAYDMHFEENEQELSVTQHADVNMTFSSPILAETGDTGVTANKNSPAIKDTSVP